MSRRNYERRDYALALKAGARGRQEEEDVRAEDTDEDEFPPLQPHQIPVIIPNPTGGGNQNAGEGDHWGNSSRNQTRDQNRTPEDDQNSDSRFHIQNQALIYEAASYMLTKSDNTGLILVSQPLTEHSFLAWRRGMILALEIKGMLDFIIRDDFAPAKHLYVEYTKWKKTDSPVIHWITNVISQDLVETFMYAATARDLWLEIEHHFGETNGPLLFQIKKEIHKLKQGDLSVCMYYTKLKKLWEELSFLRPFPMCNCNAMKSCKSNIAKQVREFEDADQVIQFLMGLTSMKALGPRS